VVQFAETAISAGAQGIMFGRHVFQSADPAALLKQVRARRGERRLTFVGRLGTERTEPVLMR
jgi:hypothetical protein